MKTQVKTVIASAILTASLGLPMTANSMSSAEPEQPSGFTETKHPIMLVQGILAFDSIAGVDYWYGIADKLESEGSTVYTAHINAVNGSVARGEQLIAELENIQTTQTDVEKFNLIAHSQGGLTARYVMAVRPDLIASVTTLGSPHQGAPIADVLNNVFPEDTYMGGAFEMVSAAVGTLIDMLSGDASGADVRALTAEFTTSGIATFNANYPAGLPTSDCGEGPASVSLNGHDISLYSWAGTDTVTNVADPLDYLFGTTGLLFSTEDSDGITGRCSSHFGQVIRDNYTMNHGDLINQVLGLHTLFDTDPLSLYRSHANRLKEAGL